MPDRLFENPKLASLYDLFSPPLERADFSFYLSVISEATSALDIGCGTGALLTLARDGGHKGNLVGIDPAFGMIEIARRNDEVCWVHGELGSSPVGHGFELAVMTGHAFQTLLTDVEIARLFEAVKSVLVPGCRFVFETRNPAIRSWKNWHKEYSGSVVDPELGRVTVECRVEEPVVDELVSFSHTFSCDKWQSPKVSHSKLRFLEYEAAREFAEEAGFHVETVFGDWDESDLTADSPEMIFTLSAL